MNEEEEKDFELWWSAEGSSRSLAEAQVSIKELCKIAWSNGIYKTKQALRAAYD